MKLQFNSLCTMNLFLDFETKRSESCRLNQKQEQKKNKFTLFYLNLQVIFHF